VTYSLATADPGVLQSTIVPAAVSLVVALAVAGAGWWWTARQNRRAAEAKLYADAYAVVQAYKEMPYAIRRRNADAPGEERVRLSEILRDIQQRISFHSAWIDIHNRNVGRAYDDLVAATRRTAGQLMHEAWEFEPISTDSAMNIADIGPQLAVLADPEVAYLKAVREARRNRP
jgi:hypothetical protein